MPRWFLDGTRVKQLAVDHTIGLSSVYTYLNEGFTVLAAWAPALESALLAAKLAGHNHISIDSALIETDRVRTPGPTHDSVILRRLLLKRAERPTST